MHVLQVRPPLGQYPLSQEAQIIGLVPRQFRQGLEVPQAEQVVPTNPYPVSQFVHYDALKEHDRHPLETQVTQLLPLIPNPSIQEVHVDLEYLSHVKH